MFPSELATGKLETSMEVQWQGKCRRRGAGMGMRPEFNLANGYLAERLAGEHIPDPIRVNPIFELASVSAGSAKQFNFSQQEVADADVRLKENINTALALVISRLEADESLIARFRIGIEEASVLEQAMHPRIDRLVLSQLPDRQVAARLLIDNKVSQAFIFGTLTVTADRSEAEQARTAAMVRQSSREKYGVVPPQTGVNGSDSQPQQHA